MTETVGGALQYGKRRVVVGVDEAGNRQQRSSLDQRLALEAVADGLDRSLTNQNVGAARLPVAAAWENQRVADEH